jgi:ABC-2 type transport system permease protein
VLRALALYGRLVRHSFRAQLEYRADSVLLAVSYVLLSASEFFALWALFSRFGSLKGWTLAEIAIFYGIVEAGIALADAISRGLDHFAEQLKSGGFDRLLLRPTDPLLLLLAEEVTLKRAGRLAQALCVLAYGALHLHHPLGLFELALLGAAIFAAATVFVGLWILQAALCFFTTESLEAMNILTYGGAQLGQYPLTILPTSLRRFFIGVVPVGLVVYYPGLAVMHRADPLAAPAWLGSVAPLAGPLFLVLAVTVFRLCVRRYQSTGS